MKVVSISENHSVFSYLDMVRNQQEEPIFTDPERNGASSEKSVIFV